MGYVKNVRKDGLCKIIFVYKNVNKGILLVKTIYAILVLIQNAKTVNILVINVLNAEITSWSKTLQNFIYN